MQDMTQASLIVLYDVSVTVFIPYIHTTERERERTFVCDHVLSIAHAISIMRAIQIQIQKERVGCGGRRVEDYCESDSV
jgi:hypothetical protein